MKTNILTIIALACITLFSSCGEQDELSELGYTPKAIGDNSWTKDLPQKDNSNQESEQQTTEFEGINPQDASLAGSIAALFQPTYEGVISVAINDEEALPTTQSVVIRAADANHINFYLKNFTLKTQDPDSGEINETPVGNIVLKNIPLQYDDSEDGVDALFSFEQPIKITAGDDASLNWLGPSLPDIPITLSGAILGELIGIEINIDMTETLGQIIVVGFTNEKDEGE